MGRRSDTRPHASTGGGTRCHLSGNTYCRMVKPPMVVGNVPVNELLLSFNRLSNATANSGIGSSRLAL